MLSRHYWVCRKHEIQQVTWKSPVWKVIIDSNFVFFWAKSVKIRVCSYWCQFSSPVLFPFLIWNSSSFKENQNVNQMRLSTFLLSLNYPGYHREYEEYCSFKTRAYQKKIFLNQIIEAGLIYLSLVFSLLSPPKRHMNIHTAKGNVHLFPE